MPAPAEDADEVLVARAQAGEQAAFVTLLRRHDPVLRALAWQVLRDRGTMDDVLKQVYLKAYLGLGGFREGASARAWLSKITWLACLEETRRAQRREGPDGPEQVDAPGAGPVPIAAGDDHVDLDGALTTLPPEQRAAVLLVDAEGYPYRDAARVLGVGPGRVASQLTPARARLHSSIDADDGPA